MECCMSAWRSLNTSPQRVCRDVFRGGRGEDGEGSSKLAALVNVELASLQG